MGAAGVRVLAGSIESRVGSSQRHGPRWQELAAVSTLCETGCAGSFCAGHAVPQDGTWVAVQLSADTRLCLSGRREEAWQLPSQRCALTPAPTRPCPAHALPETALAGAPAPAARPVPFQLLCLADLPPALRGRCGETDQAGRPQARWSVWRSPGRGREQDVVRARCPRGGREPALLWGLRVSRPCLSVGQGRGWMPLPTVPRDGPGAPRRDSAASQDAGGRLSWGRPSGGPWWPLGGGFSGRRLPRSHGWRV